MLNLKFGLFTGGLGVGGVEFQPVRWERSGGLGVASVEFQPVGWELWVGRC